jgi:hypothetical protein
MHQLSKFACADSFEVILQVNQIHDCKSRSDLSDEFSMKISIAENSLTNLVTSQLWAKLTYSVSQIIGKF